MNASASNTPPVSELLSPSNGTLIRNSPVELVWNGSDWDGNALTYYLVLDGSVFAHLNGTNISLTNVSEGNHTWTAIPNDGSVNGTCVSGKWNFTYTRNRRPASELLWPPDGSTVRTAAARMLWSGEGEEAGPLEYHLYVNGSEKQVTDATSGALEGLVNGTYTWTVIPYDRFGNGTCISGAWNFTVRLNQGPAISLLAPANGSTLNNTTVDLRWSGSDHENDTLLYGLNITDGVGSDQTYHTWSTNRTVELENGRNYSWDVTVTDGITLVTSPSYSFTIKVNHRPGILSLPPTAIRAKATYTYRVNATDVDGDRLNFSLVERPEGMTIDHNGLVLWRPSDSQAGKKFNVTVVVSDGQFEDRQQFVVRVLAGDGAGANGPLPVWAILMVVIATITVAAIVWIWFHKAKKGK